MRVGEHEHTIIGYSLVKGIGDGEPIASERFTVGGHEWVLLFYPDGKRSSSSEAGLGGGVGAAIGPPPGAGNGFEGNSCSMLGSAPLILPSAAGPLHNEMAEYVPSNDRALCCPT